MNARAADRRRGLNGHRRPPGHPARRQPFRSDFQVQRVRAKRSPILTAAQPPAEERNPNNLPSRQQGLGPWRGRREGRAWGPRCAAWGLCALGLVSDGLRLRLTARSLPRLRRHTRSTQEGPDAAEQGEGWPDRERRGRTAGRFPGADAARGSAGAESTSQSASPPPLCFLAGVIGGAGPALLQLVGGGA